MSPGAEAVQDIKAEKMKTCVRKAITSFEAEKKWFHAFSLVPLLRLPDSSLETLYDIMKEELS